MVVLELSTSGDEKCSSFNDQRAPRSEADLEQNKRSQDLDSESIDLNDNEKSGYTKFDLDNDVISRIHSRASVTSDVKRLQELSNEYPDGLLKLPMDSQKRPLNWPFKKKIHHTMAFGITTLSAQVGSSIISACADQLTEEFHIGSEVAVLTFSIFVLGNMVGPIFFAPISELFGRKIGVFIPCFIGGVFICVAANVNSIAALVVFRFLAGVFCAAPVVSSGGAMADVWHPQQRAAAMVLYAINIVMGATTAPIFGALLSTTGSYGWRWAQWLAGLLCLTISIINILTLDETYLPVVEKNMAQKIKMESGYWALHSEHDNLTFTFNDFIKIHLVRPILMLATPIVLLFVLYASFIYGLVYLIITSVSVEFQKVHHFTHVTGYLPLFALLCGFVIGGMLNVLQSKRYAKLFVKLGRKPDPEERLFCMRYGGWFVPCGMFLYGWTMKKWIHWFVPCVGLGFVGAGMAIVFQGCLIYLVDVYTKYAASAIAANTIVRSIFGGVFPLFAIQMFNGMGVHWAASLLGFVGLALCPAPWLFYYFGTKVRKHDPFGSRLN